MANKGRNKASKLKLPRVSVPKPGRPMKVRKGSKPKHKRDVDVWNDWYGDGPTWEITSDYWISP
jgi:hypothetical protein